MTEENTGRLPEGTPARDLAGPLDHTLNSSNCPLDVVRAARGYLNRGWVPVPLHAAEHGKYGTGKAPALGNGWQHVRPTPESLSLQFTRGCNIGLLLGPAGGSLADVDLDCPEAVTLGEHFLPPTGMRHGRDGMITHWWYVVPDGEDRREAYLYLGKTLVELRGGGGTQTVVPPSMHYTGARLQWTTEDQVPAVVEWSVLLDACRRIALASALMRGGWSSDAARSFAEEDVRDWTTCPADVLDCAAKWGLAPKGVARGVSAGVGRFAPDSRATERSAYTEAVLAKASVPVVLDLLGLPALDGQGRGDCPMHSGGSERSFTISGGDGTVWNCHSTRCNRGGDAIELFARVRGIGRRVARDKLAELLDVDDPRQGVNASSTRPTIIDGPDVSRVVDEAEAALVAASLRVYQRGGELVRAIERRGALVLVPLPFMSLYETLSQVAVWQKRRFKEEKNGRKVEQDPVSIRPPRDVVDTLAARGRWKLPEVEAVSDVPILRPDGSIVSAPGPDAATKTLYAPRSEWPRLPDRPTREEALTALDVLREPLRDFPFVAPSDEVAAISLVLTLIGRRAIEGPTPLYLIRAPERGTGKSLLADVVSIISTGAEAPRMSQGRDPSEEEKRLLALGREGVSLALIDNVERPLGNDVLAAALTSRSYRGRVLGSTSTVEVPVPVLVATGNNVVVAGDLGRRVVPIDLRADVENPEERTGFKIADLRAWTRANRVRLVCAALTVLRWHAAEGRPRTAAKPFGSYEAWSLVVRGPLLVLGVDDPLRGRERIREDGDPTRSAWSGVIAAIHAKHGGQWVTVTDILDLARDDQDVEDALDVVSPKRRGDGSRCRVTLGKCLGAREGTICDGLRLERTPRRKNGSYQWRVTSHVPSGAWAAVPNPASGFLSDWDSPQTAGGVPSGTGPDVAG